MPDLQGPSEPANVTWAPQEQRDGRYSNMPDLQGPSEPANVTWAPQEQRDGRSIPHFFKI